MPIFIIENKVQPEQLDQASQDYFGEYIKIVADIKRGLITIGGEWHADGEKLLLNHGSDQKDLWGGGIRLKDNVIEYNSLINIRPNLNKSQEILDSEIRAKFEKLVRQKFGTNLT